MLKTKKHFTKEELFAMGYYRYVDDEISVTEKYLRALIVNAAAHFKTDDQSEICALDELIEWAYKRSRLDVNLTLYKDAVYCLITDTASSADIEKWENIYDSAVKAFGVLVDHYDNCNEIWDDIFINGVDKDFLSKVTPQLKEKEELIRALEWDYEEIFDIIGKSTVSSWNVLIGALKYMSIFKSDLYKNKLLIAKVFYTMGYINAKREERKRRKK